MVGSRTTCAPFALFISLFVQLDEMQPITIVTTRLKCNFSDRLAAKLARKESLSQKLQQRPGRQELIDRNILYQVTEEERKVDRTLIGAKLIRRLSLRPTPEELEERNILKSNLLLYLLVFLLILRITSFSIIIIFYPSSTHCSYLFPFCFVFYFI